MLARYISQHGSKSKYSPQKKVLKQGAFLPMHNDATNRFETSCARIEGLEGEDLWLLGDAMIAATQGPPVAYGAIEVQGVRETGLGVDPDDKPPRHACIVDWPETKDAQKSLAQQLAARASLRVRGEGG